MVLGECADAAELADPSGDDLSRGLPCQPIEVSLGEPPAIIQADLLDDLRGADRGPGPLAALTSSTYWR
jgi:hypothetical protein